MVQLRRRHFLRAALGASALAAPSLRLARAQSAEFVLKFGNNNPENHPMIVAMSKAADRIKQELAKTEAETADGKLLGADGQGDVTG